MPVSEAVAVDSGASARSRACPRIHSRIEGGAETPHISPKAFPLRDDRTACPFRRRSPSTAVRRLAAEPVPEFTPESREAQKRPTSRPKRSHFVATGRRARFGGGRRRLRRVSSQQRLSQDCLEELKLLVLGVAANYSGVLRGPAKAPRLSAGPPPSVAQWLWYSALPYRRATRLDGKGTDAQPLGERASTAAALGRACRTRHQTPDAAPRRASSCLSRRMR